MGGFKIRGRLCLQVFGARGEKYGCVCFAYRIPGCSISSSNSKLANRPSGRAAMIIAAATVGLISVAAQGQLTPGIYVDQIGDGTHVGDSTTAQPLFIDSFAPGTNTPGTQIDLPTTTSGSVHTITAIADETGGTGYAQSVLLASPYGRYLGVGGTNTGTTRTIAEVDSFTSTVTTGSFSAVTVGFAAIGTSSRPNSRLFRRKQCKASVTSLPANTPSSPNSGIQRTVSIFDGQVFESGSSSTGGAKAGVNNGQGGWRHGTWWPRHSRRG